MIEWRSTNSTATVAMRVLKVSYCCLPIFQRAHACHTLVCPRYHFYHSLSSVLPSARLSLVYEQGPFREEALMARQAVHVEQVALEVAVGSLALFMRMLWRWWWCVANTRGQLAAKLPGIE